MRKNREWQSLHPQEVQDKGKPVRSDMQELQDIQVYTWFLRLRVHLCQKLMIHFCTILSHPGMKNRGFFYPSQRVQDIDNTLNLSFPYDNLQYI